MAVIKVKVAAMTRRTRRAIGSMRLTGRDEQICVYLASHHLLTADQIRRLAFHQTKANDKARHVRRRIKLLVDAKLLDKVAVVAQPTRGVPPAVYRLTHTGAAIAAANSGQSVPVRSGRSPSLRFIAHHVGVTNFYITLHEALRATTWTIGQWQHEWHLKTKGRAEHIDVFDPATEQTRNLIVLPDGYFTLRGRGQTLHYFFEFDAATHPLSKWRDRALAFSAYDREGRFSQRFTDGRAATFKMLIVTPPNSKRSSRCGNILRVIRQATNSSHLFAATTGSEVSAATVLGPIWRQPNNQSWALLPRRSTAVAGKHIPKPPAIVVTASIR